MAQRASLSGWLEAAVEAAGASDEKRLVDCLYQAWLLSRAPAIAEVLERVSLRATAGVGFSPLRRGEEGADAHPWLDMPGPDPRPTLPTIVAHAAGARVWPLERSPTRLCERLAELGDPRALSLMHAIIGPRARDDELPAYLERLRRALPEPRQLSPAERALLDELRAPFAAEERERRRRLAELDLSRREDRLVFADWLSERGDPQGELVALQLAAEHGAAAGVARGAAEEDRVRRLASLVLLNDLRALAPWLVSAQFAGGFLHQATLLCDTGALKSLTGHRAWVTLAELNLVSAVSTPTAAWAAPAAQLLQHPVMRSLQKLSGAPPELLAALLPAPRAPLGEVSVFYDHSDELEVLESVVTTQGGSLATLRLTGPPLAPPAIEWLACIGRRHLSLPAWVGDAAAWLSAAARLGLNRIELRFDRWHLIYEARARRATMRPRGWPGKDERVSVRDELLAIVGALTPREVGRVVIDDSSNVFAGGVSDEGRGPSLRRVLDRLARRRGLDIDWRAPSPSGAPRVSPPPPRGGWRRRRDH